MVEKFIIPYPKTQAGKKAWAKNYGLNKYWAGVHWAIRKRDADFWHALVSSEMNNQSVRKFPFQNAVIITFYWNDRLAIDNRAAMGKLILDAMKGRVIKDDSRRWVKGVEHYFHDENFIRVIVREALT